MEKILKDIYRKYYINDIVQLGDVLLDEDIDVYNQELLSSGNIGYISRSDADEWSIGVDESLDAYLKRFVIAHELGHYFLHKDLVPQGHVRVDSRDAIRWREVSTLLPEDYSSYEANAFAAKILMPKNTIKKALRGCAAVDALTRKKLSLFFGVPEQALFYRLLDLGYEQ